MAKNKAATKGGADAESGLFRTLFHQGLKKLAGVFQNSCILRFISDYDGAEEYACDSLVVRSVQSVRRFVRRKIVRAPHRELGTEQLNKQEVGVFVPSTLHRSMKTRIGAAMENSKILQKTRALLQGALYVSMMSYGVLFFSFGLFTTVMQAMLYFLLRPSNSAALDLFVGLALVLISLPIMFKGYEPMLDSFRDSVTGNLVLRALRSTSAQSAPDKVYKPTFLFFIVGMAGGLLTYFAPPLVLLLIVLIVITALCVLYVPESGVCLILILLPFMELLEHPSLLCAATVLYTGLCLLLKVMVGKRSLSFGLMDGVILFFGLLILSTGIRTGTSSAESALLYAAMVAGYFVTADLLRSPAWIRRSLNVWVASSLLVSATGIIDQIWNFNGSVALLDNTLVANCYLIAVIPVAMVNWIQSRRGMARLGNFLVLVADIVCLVMLGSAIGIIALIVELLFFFVFYTRKIWIALWLILISMPFVSYVVWPSNQAVQEVLCSLGNGELWSALWRVYRHAPLSGIGLSDSVLLSAIMHETAVDLSLSNIWLRMLVQIGIPGVLVFLTVLLLWYMAGFTLLKKYGSKQLASCQYLGILSAVTGLLLIGNFSYIWSDNRMLLLFWMSAGIARALLRAAKRSEEVRDEQPVYQRSDGVYCVDQDFTFRLERSAAGNMCSTEQDLL